MYFINFFFSIKFYFKKKFVLIFIPAFIFLGNLLYSFLNFSNIIIDNIYLDDKIKKKFFNEHITPNDIYDESTEKEKIKKIISTEAKKTQLLNIENFSGTKISEIIKN